MSTQFTFAANTDFFITEFTIFENYREKDPSKRLNFLLTRPENRVLLLTLIELERKSSPPVMTIKLESLRARISLLNQKSSNLSKRLTTIIKLVDG